MAKKHASAINSSDQVVGYIQPNIQQGDFTSHATLWDDGIVTDLGTLPGFDSTDATGINDSGEVVGIAFSTALPQNQVGFQWTVHTAGGSAHRRDDLRAGSRHPGGSACHREKGDLLRRPSSPTSASRLGSTSMADRLPPKQCFCRRRARFSARPTDSPMATRYRTPLTFSNGSVAIS